MRMLLRPRTGALRACQPTCVGLSCFRMNSKRLPSPPYNPGVRDLVAGKHAWSHPLPKDAIERGFLGWHENGYLPHRDEPGLVQFVTFRLADAFPAELRWEWDALLKMIPTCATRSMKREHGITSRTIRRRQSSCRCRENGPGAARGSAMPTSGCACRGIDGVRPSPGAAAFDSSNASRLSETPRLAGVAAPEDGRTPIWIDSWGKP